MRNLARVSVLRPLGGSTPMRILARRLISSFLLLTLASPPSWGDDGNAQPAFMDQKLLEWCLSYFSRQDGKAAALPQPAKALAPLKLEEMIAPPDLVTQTQIAGKLPANIEKYQGTWIWPSASQSPFFAIFVECLTSQEMTIAFVPRRPQNEEVSARFMRMTLFWTGTEFSDSKPEGLPNYRIKASRFGDAWKITQMIYPGPHLLETLLVLVTANAISCTPPLVLRPVDTREYAILGRNCTQPSIFA